MERLERLECDDGIFAAADRDEVAAKVVVEMELLLLRWRRCVDRQETFERHEEVINEH